jgi:hypothetical protein
MVHGKTRLEAAGRRIWQEVPKALNAMETDRKSGLRFAILKSNYLRPRSGRPFHGLRFIVVRDTADKSVGYFHSSAVPDFWQT